MLEVGNYVIKSSLYKQREIIVSDGADASGNTRAFVSRAVFVELLCDMSVPLVAIVLNRVFKKFQYHVFKFYLS